MHRARPQDGLWLGADGNDPRRHVVYERDHDVRPQHLAVVEEAHRDPAAVGALGGQEVEVDGDLVGLSGLHRALWGAHDLEGLELLLQEDVEVEVSLIAGDRVAQDLDDVGPVGRVVELDLLVGVLVRVVHHELLGLGLVVPVLVVEEAEVEVWAVGGGYVDEHPASGGVPADIEHVGEVPVSQGPDEVLQGVYPLDVVLVYDQALVVLLVPLRRTEAPDHRSGQVYVGRHGDVEVAARDDVFGHLVVRELHGRGHSPDVAHAQDDVLLVVLPAGHNLVQDDLHEAFGVPEGQVLARGPRALLHVVHVAGALGEGVSALGHHVQGVVPELE